MNKYFFLFLFLNFTLVKAQKNIEILKVSELYAPDSRESIYEIEYDSISNVLKGKTNIVAAKTELLKLFKSKNPVDSIKILPDLWKGFIGIVNVSVGNMRYFPAESAEMASQVWMGMPLEIFEKTNGWFRVKSPDGYIGWIGSSSLTVLKSDEYINFSKLKKLIFIKDHGRIYESPRLNSFPISDIVFGNTVVLQKKLADFYEVQLPDGRTGFVESNKVAIAKNWLETLKPNAQSLIKFSFEMRGIPYLWGGTSFKGVDCSGFTRTAFFSQGIMLPRDASQQAKVGEKIEINNNFSNLLPGDLLFFGNTMTKKVSHVAIWMGDLKFIHSSGMVKVNSVDPYSELYDEYNTNRLLLVKRINFGDKNLINSYLNVN